MGNGVEFLFQESVTNLSRSYSLNMTNVTTSTLLLLASLKTLLCDFFYKDQTFPWPLAQSSILPVDSRETVGDGTEAEEGTRLWGYPPDHPHPLNSPVAQEGFVFPSLCCCGCGCVVTLVLYVLIQKSVNVFSGFRVTSYFQSFSMNSNLIVFGNIS